MMKIREFIEGKLVEENNVKRERSGKMNPSRFGQCFRRQFKDRRNDVPSNPLTVDNLKTFFAGNIIEEIITKKMSGEFKQIEVEEEDVKGFVDYIKEEDDEIVEVKSINSWVFKNKLPKEDNIDDLFGMCPQYVLQSTYYAMKKGKSNVRLVFVSKNLDKLEIKEYEFKTERFRKFVEDEISVNRSFWMSQEVPPMVPRLFDRKECNYCEWNNECKKKEF